eukprot:TRINITY_DN3841_c0_g1_i1.p1 TRINITY_DN3841_c0_g1~~TRINITY_DN3841_c0_g1_i1.p1  ORF type:complete len:1357 (+),score=316.94 TRINITY_DN3841_c0_g1_i1:110-4180(+)
MGRPAVDPRLVEAAASLAASLPDDAGGAVRKLNVLLAIADRQGQLASLREQAYGSVGFQLGDAHFLLRVPAEGAAPPCWARVEAAEASAASCGVRVDGVQTLKDILVQKASGPALLARRRVAIRGSMAALQRFGQAIEAVDAVQVLSALPADFFAPPPPPCGAAESGASVARTRASRALDPFARRPLARSWIPDEAVQECGDCGSRFTALDPFARRPLARSWIPDEAVQECGDCGSRFTVLRRRHHCRACGGVFCGSCAPRPTLLCTVLQTGRGGGRGRRVCVGCRDACPEPATGTSTTAGSSGSENGAMGADGEVATPAFDSADGGGGASMPSAMPDGRTAAGPFRAELRKLEEDLRTLRELQLHDLTGSWVQTTLALVLAAALSPLPLALVAYSMDLRRTAAALVASVCVSLLFGYYLLSRQESLTRRRLRVFWMAIMVWLRFRGTRKRCRGLTRGSRQYEILWEETHRVVAFFVQLHFKDLRGFWVKLGQYASTRADVLPDPYVEWLGKLQDQMPSAPIEAIRVILEAELGAELAATLSVEREPLAAASIAQVHRATVLGHERHPVVVKVQHEGVDVVMTQDIRSLELVLWVIAKVEPDFDLRPLIDEWKKASKAELDFKNEASNQTRARNALVRAGMDSEVLIPEVWPKYTRRRVMVMDFVDGVKISEARTELPGLDQTQLLRRVVDAFAFQLHVDGHFNGDPHPGNLLVERETMRPVMLDWGLCKTFTEPKKMAFAKMVYAVNAKDIWTMMDSFEEMGFKFKSEDDTSAHLEPGTALEVMRFILRDSASGDTKELMRQRGEVDQKKFHHDRKMKRRDPVEAFSGEVLFFFRTVDCLQGVCAGLGVQLPFLSLLAKQARAALLEASAAANGPPLTPHAFLPGQGQAGSQKCIGPLHEKLSKLLSEYYRNGQLVGAQVAAISGGAARTTAGSAVAPVVLADVAVGVLGPLDPKPVTPATLFVSHGLGQLALSAVLLDLIDRGHLHLSQRLAERWPAFAAAGKQDVTVEQVLNRTAGLWHVFPKGLTLGALLDLDKMLASLEQAKPLESPGSAQAHHYWSFGWLVAGVCRHLCQRELRECWKDFLDGHSRRSQANSTIEMRREILLPGKELCDGGVDVATVQKPTVDGVDVAELMAAIARMEMEVDASPSDPAWCFFDTILTREHLLDPQLYNLADAKRAESLCGQGIHASARAMASLLEQIAARPTSAAGRALRAASDASSAASADASKEPPEPPLAEALRRAPAPLPGIIADLFDDAGEEGSLGAAASWHAGGFQSLPSLCAGAAGLRAVESGAFVAWLPSGESGAGGAGSGGGVSVCLLVSRVDAEASGLAKAVAALVAEETKAAPAPLPA